MNFKPPRNADVFTNRQYNILTDITTYRINLSRSQWSEQIIFFVELSTSKSSFFFISPPFLLSSYPSPSLYAHPPPLVHKLVASVH